MTLCYTVPALDTFYEYYSDFHFSFLVDTGWLLPWALILLLNSSFWLVSPTALPCSWVCVCVCVCVCKVAQSCPILCNPMDCDPPGSSVLGILQARILEWVAISFSRGSSQLRYGTHVSYVSCPGRQGLYLCTPWGAPLLPYVSMKKNLKTCKVLVSLWSFLLIDLNLFNLFFSSLSH